MGEKLDARSLELLFTGGRTFTAWQSKPIEDSTLRHLYDLAALGPTSANTCPMRLVFVRTPAAKERLRPTLSPGNVEKTMSAPVTVIVATDYRFFELIPKLWPHNPKFAEMFTQPGKEEFTRTHAFRNATLQAGYLIMAARALGLDVGPMSGFDNEKVDAAFISDIRWKSNFLINLGYGDPSNLHPRNPRPSFDEACRLV